MKPLQFFILSAFLIITNTLFAQGTLAKLKFESAEQYYLNKNYQSCLDKLAELESEGMKNPKILHLKIMAKNDLITARYAEEAKTKVYPTATQQIELFNGYMQFKKEVNFYLEKYDIAGLEDKYKQVYQVSEMRRYLFDESAQTAWIGHKFYLEKKYDIALEWFLKAIEINGGDFAKGTMRYNYVEEIGYMYYYGMGTDKNFTEAKKWFERGVEIKSNYCAFQLGHIYFNGDGVIQDYNKAVELYSIAAEGGNKYASSKMGYFTLFGLYGVKQDTKKAYYWYSKQPDNINDKSILGKFYYDGSVAPKDYIKALDFFKQGLGIEGGFNTALMYYTGKGVSQNKEQAVKMFLDKHGNYFENSIKGYWPGDFKKSLDPNEGDLAKAFPVYSADALSFIEYLNTHGLSGKF